LSWQCNSVNYSNSIIIALSASRLNAFHVVKHHPVYSASDIRCYRLHTVIQKHLEQVAQLWQRDRAKLGAFSINVQRYLQNHKIAFLGHPIGASGAIQALYMKVLMQMNFVAKFHRGNASFTLETES